MCANPLSIIPDLTGTLGIPNEKNKVYECEKIMPFPNESVSLGNAMKMLYGCCLFLCGD